MPRNCLICGVQVDDNRDFCTPCYQKKIWEINEMVNKKKASPIRVRVMKRPRPTNYLGGTRPIDFLSHRKEESQEGVLFKL